MLNLFSKKMPSQTARHAPQGEPLPRGFQNSLSRWTFAALILSVIYLTYRLFLPYLVQIFLAVALAVTFQPIFRQLTAWFRGRRSVAAFLTILLAGAIIMVPMFFMAGVITSQAYDLYSSVSRQVQGQELQTTISAGLGRLKPYLDRLHETFGVSQQDIVRQTGEAIRQVSALLYGNLTNFLRGFTEVLIGFMLVLFVAFYLLKDGEHLAAKALSFSPLPEDTNRNIVEDVLQALKDTLRGTVVMAILHGSAGGAIFYFFSIPNSLFWGTVMVFASVVPLIGTALVWVPASVYLFILGKTYAGVGVGVLCLGSMLLGDNILRPRLITGHTEVHPLLAFFSILGGLSLFGLVGLILGPLVLAVLIALLEVYSRYFQKPPEICAPQPKASRRRPAGVHALARALTRRRR